MMYDVIIIGAGPGGIFSAYELMKMKPQSAPAAILETTMHTITAQLGSTLRRQIIQAAEASAPARA